MRIQGYHGQEEHYPTLLVYRLRRLQVGLRGQVQALRELQGRTTSWLGYLDRFGPCLEKYILIYSIPDYRVESAVFLLVDEVCGFAVVQG